MTSVPEPTGEIKLWELFGYALRPSVEYTDGRDSAAPLLLFADFDYEVGDGVCGLHADGRQANEPAIIYVRVDSLVDALARAEAAEEKEHYSQGSRISRFHHAGE